MGTRGQWGVGAGIVLLALNLRLAVGSLGVVLDDLRADLGMGPLAAGLLTTLPVLCFAIFGVSAGPVVRRLGLNRTAVAVLVVTGAGIATRVLVDSPALFLLMSMISLGACAVGNVILPALAKTHCPDRLALISSLYGAALMGGAALGAVATVPVANALGGWRVGLGVWALVAVVALLPWLPRLGRDVRLDPTSTPLRLTQLTRSPVAWACALCFGVQSGHAYAQFGWFPAIIADTAGVTPATAGTLLAVLSSVGIPMALALPVLIRWAGPRPVLPWSFALLTTGGWLGVLLAPAAAPLLWAVMLGLAGGAFPWTLTMIGRRTRSPAGTTALSGFAQSTGYLLASVFPFGVGLLHGAVDDWSVVLVVLAASGLLIGVLGTQVNRDRDLEDDLAS